MIAHYHQGTFAAQDDFVLGDSIRLSQDLLHRTTGRLLRQMDG